MKSSNDEGLIADSMIKYLSSNVIRHNTLCSCNLQRSFVILNQGGRPANKIKVTPYPKGESHCLKSIRSLSAGLQIFLSNSRYCYLPRFHIRQAHHDWPTKRYFQISSGLTPPRRRTTCLWSLFSNTLDGPKSPL